MTVPIAVLQWYRLQCYAWYRFSAIVTFSKFMTLLEGMRISDKDLGGKKRENCQLTNLQLFQIILILPFMAVPGFSHYAGSSISKLFGGKKDLLYSFMAKDNID